MTADAHWLPCANIGLKNANKNAQMHGVPLIDENLSNALPVNRHCHHARLPTRVISDQGHSIPCTNRAFGIDFNIELGNRLETTMGNKANLGYLTIPLKSSISSARLEFVSSEGMNSDMNNSLV